MQYVIEAKGRPAVQASQRRAVLVGVRVLLCHEVEPAQVRAVVGPKRLLSVPGHLEGDALWHALVRDHQLKDPIRWFLTEPVHVDGETWVVSNQWGKGTHAVLAGLAALRPDLLKIEPAAGNSAAKAAPKDAPKAAPSSSKVAAPASVPSEVEALCRSLEADLMYQLSSGGRELFHSNLLYWLAVNRPAESSPVWELLGTGPATGTFPDVRREWRNIDLFVDPGPTAPQLVLENKVLAIPTAAQLEAYTADLVLQPNVRADASWVLISLLDPQFDMPEDWRFVSYLDLVPAIEATAAAMGRAEGGQLLAYAEMVRHLLAVRQTFDPAGRLEEAWLLPTGVRDRLQAARALTLVEKLRASRVAAEVETRLRRQAGRPVTPVGSGLSHTHGLIEWFTPFGDGYSLGWQYQERQFRFVVRTPKEPGMPRKQREAYAERHHAAYFRADPPPELAPLLTPYTGQKEWLGFEPNFVYRYQRLAAKATNEDLVELCMWAAIRALDYVATSSP